MGKRDTARGPSDTGRIALPLGTTSIVGGRIVGNASPTSNTIKRPSDASRIALSSGPISFPAPQSAGKVAAKSLAMRRHSDVSPTSGGGTQSAGSSLPKTNTTKRLSDANRTMPSFGHNSPPGPQLARRVSPKSFATRMHPDVGPTPVVGAPSAGNPSPTNITKRPSDASRPFTYSR